MKNPVSGRTSFISLVFCAGLAGLADPASSQETDLPVYLQDRGTGMATSMFGVYIHRGELLVYPFFEYYRDHDAEYAPEELGYGLDEDFRGKYRAYEGLILLSYGIAEWMSVELEVAVISATLETSPEDPTDIPAKIEESGLGDVEGQLRFRLMRETEGRPELFSYSEAVAPLQKKKLLIGTQDWELKSGLGVTKGFAWGTMTLRAAAEYDAAESKLDLGECAVEYLKRLSPAWRVYLGVEGTQDEIELITEAQWHITDSMFLKLNSAFGITSKATDWAPEVGVVFSFPSHRK